MHIYRTNIRFGIVAPQLVHNLLSGKSMVREREQFIKKLKLFLWKNLGFFIDRNGQVNIIQADMVKLQFLLIDNFCPAEECFHTEQQFIDINGFDHVVVNTEFKSFCLIRESIFGSHDQNRELITAVTKCFGQIITIHARHHQISNNEINISLIQHFECLLPIESGRGLIAIFI